jgi:hypothetical protein
MKLSIFTTISDYENNHWKESLQSYLDLADEVVVVNGANKEVDITNLCGAYGAWSGLPSGLKFIYYKWAEEFKFDFIGQQFQRGYEACTGDWVIRADIDYVFHEKDMDNIRQTLENLGDAPAASLLKWQFILPDRYNLKSRTVVAVNRGMYGDRIRFDSGGDLCQPSLDGKQIIEPPCITVPIYNYEHLLKTEKVLKEDIGKMDRAYRRTFNKSQYGDDYWQGWKNMMEGRIKKHSKPIPLSDHPKYIQETIKNLKPEQFGYDNFGETQCSYF